MANEKFKVLKVINHGEWLRGCPIYIVRSQIIYNNEVSKTFIVNEMANIGTRVITGIVIKIECMDENGNLLDTVDNCSYQNINVASQAIFGGNKLFAIPDGTQNVSVIIKSVTYSDSTVWNNDYLLKGQKISNPVKIDPNDPVYDVVQTRCNDNHITPKFWPQEFTGGWRCTCAQLNDDENIACSLCGASKFWILDNLNRDDIVEYKERVEREIRLRIEREAEERRLAAEREAEEARLAAEREAEERRRAEEEERLAAEREAEEKRLAEERAIEEARLAEERAIEEAKRIEAEKKAAEERARMELLMAKKEAVRQYNMKQSRKSAKNSLILVGLVIVAVIAVVGIFNFVQWIRIDDRYEGAKDQIAKYNYQEAINTYKSLGDYKDSAELVTQTKYEYAEYLAVINKYSESIALYKELGTYQDSQAKIEEVYFKWAEYCRENGQYNEAFEYYSYAGELIDEQILVETRYEYAEKLMEDGSYKEAIDMFKQTNDKVGSKTKIAECYYYIGKSFLEQSRFEEAIEAFKNSYYVNDTKELNKKAYYLMGNKYLAGNKLVEAYECFLNAGDYQDAASKKENLNLDMALSYYEKGNYNAALIYFDKVADKSSVSAEYSKAKYEKAEYLSGVSADASVLEIYKILPADYENVSDRIKVIEKYVDYVGKYESTNENASVKNVFVNLKIVDGVAKLTANGEEIDLEKLTSEHCTLNKNGSLKFEDEDGDTYTYSKK